MQKRRQFRLRHRTQRSLGKKEKITTQKIGKYTARYCDILNRNNRKRQKERVSRHQGRKSRRLHKKTRQRPTAASGREAARHINPEYDLRLIRKKTRRIARRKNERSHRKKSTDYRKSSQCKNAERGQTKQKQGTTSNKQGKISETIESTKARPDTVSSQKNRRQRGAYTPCRRFQQRLLINVSQNA